MQVEQRADMTETATSAGTIPCLLLRGAGDAPALLAPDRPALSRRALADFCRGIAGELRRAGVERKTRVAVHLANGPAMAAAFLAVSHAAVAAPLNPAATEAECAFCLTDMGVRLLITDRADGPAARAARAGNVPCLVLSERDDDPAGIFTLTPVGAAASPDHPAPVPDEAARPGDTALVLHTSGTTSRPKIVPLTHRNLTASAAHVATALDLRPGERCLNMMPLFHIHGLVAAILASLHGGGSIWCAPGFNALSFFNWLTQSGAHWYSAVPTMHQALLARAGPHRATAAQAGLRFVRSSSAALAPAVMGELAALFRCPVVESYGMTEAAHQMTSNPVAPEGGQKPGAVGLPAGPEVRLATPDGITDAAGKRGEIVIRGANVMSAYDAPAAVNAAAFLPDPDGGAPWFRTGDEGYFDEEHYLHVTGRLKEIINRGGEKIAPLEVEDVLLRHPDVAEAVCFAMPHPKLGEDVAAALVLRPGCRGDVAPIRAFAGAHLSAFKLPRRILLLEALPKGATGKIRRIGLAAQLGLDGSGGGDSNASGNSKDKDEG